MGLCVEDRDCLMTPLVLIAVVASNVTTVLVARQWWKQAGQKIPVPTAAWRTSHSGVAMTQLTGALRTPRILSPISELTDVTTG